MLVRNSDWQLYMFLVNKKKMRKAMNYSLRNAVLQLKSSKIVRWDK